MRYAEPISRLIDALTRLPGIGEKSASRLAMYVLNSKRQYVEELSRCLIGVKDNVRLCSECMTFSEDDPCRICSDPGRDPSRLCVVGDYKDMVAIESSVASIGAQGESFRGKYHILHGLLAPLKGIGPDEIRLKELIDRVEKGGIVEVIVATSFDSEGEATAIYISKLLKPYGVRLTRLASGVPAGGSIEYMDPTTLLRAMQGRMEL